MTQRRKRDIWTLVIGSSVLIVFIFLFFSGGGPEYWVLDRWRKLLVAIVFGIGYLSFFTMIFMTRTKPDQKMIIKDERARFIDMKSSQTALIVLLLYVYLMSIFLYVRYEWMGYLPVGWMWFIGYSSIFLGAIVYSGTSLILDYRRGEHDEN